MKCDVIIPVYFSPEWVKLCIESVIKYTPDDYLNSIIVVDDGSDLTTRDLLASYANENKKIQVINNETNLGFVKSVNKGISHSTAPYVLLLNSDCLITKNTIPKLISHAQKDLSIGLISPVSNNSPIVTLDMLQGYSFIDMNELLEKLFYGQCFNACTIVGNCLLITRDCINITGLFDISWGVGYGEETDYQFRAMEKDFKAKIAIDTYVYHKSEASFGKDDKINEHKKKNHQLFMEKWGKEYVREMEKYSKNDPIIFINKKIKEYFKSAPRFPEYDVLYFLPVIAQNVGGVHVVIDLINYLIMNNIKAGLAVHKHVRPFADKMFFNFIYVDSYNDFLNGGIKTSAITATSWDTVSPCCIYSVKNSVPLIYFVQGYEVLFCNGNDYGKVELTYSAADDVITISGWLHDSIKKNFNVESHVVPNGYEETIFYPGTQDARSGDRASITMVLRGSVEKGDWLLMDLSRRLLSDLGDKVDINIIYFNENIAFSKAGNINTIKGPLSKKELARLFRSTDIFVDASFYEGFGLFPLEAMACGAVVVASDSGGINQFISNGQNGIVIKEMNKSERYYEEIRKLVLDKDYFNDIRGCSIKSVSDFSQAKTMKKHLEYIRNLGNIRYDRERKSALYTEPVTLNNASATALVTVPSGMQENMTLVQRFKLCIKENGYRYTAKRVLVYITGSHRVK